MPNAGSLVEERYAEALSELVLSQPNSKRAAEELGAVVEVISDYRELAATLINPNIKLSEKKAVLKEIFNGRVRKEILNFLMLLTDKGRISHLEGIYRHFVILQEKNNNILRMKLYVAFPIPEEQIKQICNKYRDLYGAADVNAEVEIDQSLLGGVKIQIGDKVIDDSVKGKMNGLKKFLSVQ